MYIRSFWAKGYRSLRDVHIENFGPFNVFYGPNGSGKSNILSAIRALFILLECRSQPGISFKNLRGWWIYEDGEHASDSGAVLRAEDRCNLLRSPEMTLGATIEWDEHATRRGLEPVSFSELTVEIRVEWDTCMMRIERLEAANFDIINQAPLSADNLSIEQEKIRARNIGTTFDLSTFVASQLGFESGSTDEDYCQALRRMVHWISQHAVSLVGAERYPRAERLSGKGHDIAWLLSQGRIKEALYRASVHRDKLLRLRFKQLQELLQGPLLDRPPFEMTHDPDTNRIELMEQSSDSAGGLGEVPLDLAGLGIAQIYVILGGILLQPARAVGIEEPEAHLHAPTTGIQLRKLLERLVDGKYIDQLFIATHSNLFDLDLTGYFDVAFDRDKGTVVERKPLTEIDKHHLYEPGPAKHALQGFLDFMDESEIVFRRSDTGAPVTVKEMLDLLQCDDPLALEFLADVHAAAVRAVRVKSKKETPGK